MAKLAEAKCLDTLQSLQIWNEKLRAIPRALAEDQPRLLAYLRDLRLNGSTPAPNITLGVVGHGGHGKSTLVQRVVLADPNDNALFAGVCARSALRCAGAWVFAASD